MRFTLFVVVVALTLVACGNEGFDEEEPNNSTDTATPVFTGFPQEGIVAAGDDDFWTTGGSSGLVRWHLELTGGAKAAGLLLEGSDQLQCTPGDSEDLPPPPRLLCNDDGSFDLDTIDSVVIVRADPCGLCVLGASTSYALELTSVPFL